MRSDNVNEADSQPPAARSLMINNGRTSPRAPVELKVEYKQLNTFFSDYTKNICKGGTFIRTKNPLPIGTEFVFQLTVPHLLEPLQIRGQVRWVKKEDEPSPVGVPVNHEPGMGIRFIYKDPEERIL